jgi:glucose/arabinose dehydrogenase
MRILTRLALLASFGLTPLAVRAQELEFPALSGIKLPAGFKINLFASGWLDERTGEDSGRPVAIAQFQDGSVLVSDDLVGAIY